MTQQRFLPKALMGATSLTLALQAAWAQTPAETDTAQLGTVVITGIRKSLESAVNTKRNAQQIVDAIVAEDIGKLPDRNVAESLARVSGVQVDRGIGEGSSVSVRGLRQNVTRLTAASGWPCGAALPCCSLHQTADRCTVWPCPPHTSAAAASRPMVD